MLHYSCDYISTKYNFKYYFQLQRAIIFFSSSRVQFEYFRACWNFSKSLETERTHEACSISLVASGRTSRRKKLRNSGEVAREVGEIDRIFRGNTKVASSRGSFIRSSISPVRHKRPRGGGIFQENWARGRVGASKNAGNVSTAFSRRWTYWRRKRRELEGPEERRKEEEGGGEGRRGRKSRGEKRKRRKITEAQSTERESEIERRQGGMWLGRKTVAISRETWVAGRGWCLHWKFRESRWRIGQVDRFWLAARFGTDENARSLSQQ